MKGVSSFIMSINTSINQRFFTGCTKWILASASPRRQELLRYLIPEFDIMTSSLDEQAEFVSPEQYVMDLSYSKANDISSSLLNNISYFNDKITDQFVIIGADTIVFHNGIVLGKPKDPADACSMLRSLSSQTHEVYTGVTFIKLSHTNAYSPIAHSFYECTKVRVSPLSEVEISTYVHTNDPLDKAGSYGIQGIFSKHICGIDGDYFNAVGFPVHRIYEELKLFSGDMI